MHTLWPPPPPPPSPPPTLLLHPPRPLLSLSSPTPRRRPRRRPRLPNPGSRHFLFRLLVRFIYFAGRGAGLLSAYCPSFFLSFLPSFSFCVILISSSFPPPLLFFHITFFLPLSFILFPSSFLTSITVSFLPFFSSFLSLFAPSFISCLLHLSLRPPLLVLIHFFALPFLFFFLFDTLLSCILQPVFIPICCKQFCFPRFQTGEQHGVCLSLQYIDMIQFSVSGSKAW